MYQVIMERQKHPRPADDHITDQHWNFMTSCLSMMESIALPLKKHPPYK
jgi:hypothetical protein